MANPVEDNPLARHGHLSYLEIPATDPQASAAFYEAVFGWRVERRDDGRFSFTETTGALIGRWVTDRPIVREPGLMCYIYVANIDDAISHIPTLGGRVVAPKREEGDIWVATFTDPAGNRLGVWQFDAGRQG